MNANHWTETSRRILLVEDDRGALDSVKTILEDEGYRVTCAENGWEALELLRAGGPPDIIVLDLRMPIMDGWEFRALQKRSPQVADVPVVAVSSDGSARAAAIDADAYLRKPLEAGALLATIEQVLAANGPGERREETGDSALARVAEIIGREINDPLAYLTVKVDQATKELGRIAERGANPSGDEREELFHASELLAECREELDRIGDVASHLQILAIDEPRERPPNVRGRVLVIDDEPLVGRTVQDALDGDYEVVTASLATEAFSRLVAGEVFDVILCDLMMSVTSGREIYDRLRVHWPNAAHDVVFMVPGSFSLEAGQLLTRTARRVLFKPLRADELRAVVEEQLEEHLGRLN